MLLLIWLIWAAAYVLGLLNKVEKRDGTRRIPLWTKLIMIALTLLVAGSGWVVGRSPFTTLALLGLAYGALADLILADVFHFDRPLIPAMVVFAAGHLCYIGAAITAPRSGVPLLVGLLSALLAAGAWRLLAYNPGGSRALNTGSLIYGMLLFVTVGLALSAAISSRVFFVWLFATGVTLFAASDVLLAQNVLRGTGPASLRDVVWGIYSGGQTLIAFALWYAV